MTRGGFGLFGLPSVAMVKSPDGLREQIVYLPPVSQDLIAAANAAAIVANPSLTAAAIAAGIAADAHPVAADEGTLLASAVRNSDTNTADQTNTSKARGAIIILDVTAVTALQTLTVNLQLKDPASGKYLTLATTGALGATATATGTYGLISHPGFGSLIGSLSTLFGTSLYLPYTWRAQVDHSGAGNFTYSLGRVLTH